MLEPLSSLRSLGAWRFSFSEQLEPLSSLRSLGAWRFFGTGTGR